MRHRRSSFAAIYVLVALIHAAAIGWFLVGPRGCQRSMAASASTAASGANPAREAVQLNLTLADRVSPSLPPRMRSSESGPEPAGSPVAEDPASRLTLPDTAEQERLKQEEEARRQAAAAEILARQREVRRQAEEEAAQQERERLKEEEQQRETARLQELERKRQQELAAERDAERRQRLKDQEEEKTARELQLEEEALERERRLVAEKERERKRRLQEAELAEEKARQERLAAVAAERARLQREREAQAAAEAEAEAEARRKQRQLAEQREAEQRRQEELKRAAAAAAIEAERELALEREREAAETRRIERARVVGAPEPEGSAPPVAPAVVKPNVVGRVPGGTGGEGVAEVPPSEATVVPAKPAGSGGEVAGPVDMGAYRATVQKMIQNRWSIPRGIAVEDHPEVVVRINRAGRVVYTRNARASGIPELDRSALNAVRIGSQLIPLPPGYDQDVYEVTVKFQVD